MRDQEGSVCPKCGEPSVSPPAEVYCVECATEGWQDDAAAWRRARRDGEDLFRSPAAVDGAAFDESLASPEGDCEA